MNRKIRKEPKRIKENPGKWRFQKEENDLDIIEVYRKLEKQLNNPSSVLSRVDKVASLKTFKNSIEEYCKARKIDFDFHFTFSHLVIPSTEKYYLFCLSMALISWDIYKMRRFLNFQRDKYHGGKSFVKLVEFRAYTILKNNSPLKDIKKRQALIMKWVEEENEKQEELLKKVASDKRINKLKKGKTLFEDLFRDKSQIQIIDKILLEKKIISKDGAWKGITDKSSEVLALIKVLGEKDYLKQCSKTLTGKLFCKKFNLKLGDRSLRGETQAVRDTHSKYNKIIPGLNS